MAKYIDVEKLQLEPDPWGGMNGVLILGRSAGKTIRLVQDALRKMIDNAPTVDAVEVVRCKHCINWKKPWLEGQHLGRCMKGKTAMTEPEDFCSYGERRTDE